MATSATGTVGLTVATTLQKAFDLSDPKNALNIARPISFTNGTGNGQINAIWHRKDTVLEGGTNTVDLEDLVDSFGDALAFANIKAIYFKNFGTDTFNVIALAPNAPNTTLAWMKLAATVTVGASAISLLVSPLNLGVGVSTGVSSVFDIVNVSLPIADIDYEIIIAGVKQ